MSKDKLNVGILIEEAEELIYDGKIEFAYSGERNVQVIEYDNGDKYQLSVKMEFIKRNENSEPTNY